MDEIGRFMSTEQSDCAPSYRPVIHFGNHNNEISDYNGRIVTFNGKWPSDAAVNADECAKAGFQYKGPGDKVQCQYCHGILYAFETGDDPLEEHMRHFDRCPFIVSKKYEALNRQLKQLTLEPKPDCSPVQLQQKVQHLSIHGNSTSSLGNNSYQADSVAQAAYRYDTTSYTSEIIQKPQQGPKNINDVMNTNAVKIVKKLGYSDEDIERAVKGVLSGQVSLMEITTDHILDKLFEIQDQSM